MRSLVLRVALAGAASLACASAASAQTYIRCTHVSGDSRSGAYPWMLATYELTPTSIRTWDEGSGWSVNHAVGNSYSVTDDSYTLTFRRVHRGQYAYTNEDWTITIQRRTGFITADYRSEQFGNDGRPNPYNQPFPVTGGRAGVGQCAVTTDPAKAAQKF